MTTDWMVYCAVWSLLVSGAAWIIECVLRRGRAPLRALWIAALTLSIVGPVVGYFIPRPSASALPTTPSLSSPATVVTTFAATHASMRRAAVPTIGPSANVLIAGWGVLSAATFVYVVVGIVYLRFLRRHWRSESVCGTEVLVSEDTGPAVIGMVRPEIVIPEWALELDPRQLSLALRHEREHQRAGDTALLGLAQLVVIALPWNPVVWWQGRRLRLAIELDCDARVLRAEPDVRSYGNLLLEVRRPRRAFALAGASLADRAGDLEQRIRMMTRRPRGVSTLGLGVSVVTGLVAIAAGCGVPAPQHPAPAEARPNTAATTPVSSPTAATPTTIARTDSSEKTIARSPTSDSSEVQRLAALKAAVNAALESARASRLVQDTSRARSIEAIRKQLADSFSTAAAIRASQSFPILSDSEAAVSGFTACSAGAGRDDSYVVKLLVPDSMARRDGRIDIAGRPAADDRTSITVDDPQAGGPLMTCSMNRTGTLRLYGPEAFGSAAIVINVTGPTSVIVTTGAGRLLAGPVLVVNEKRRYSMTWSAIP